MWGGTCLEEENKNAEKNELWKKHIANPEEVPQRVAELMRGWVDTSSQDRLVELFREGIVWRSQAWGETMIADLGYVKLVEDKYWFIVH